MCYARPSVAVLFAFLFLLPSVPSIAELPPLFEGELNVCNRVEQERAKGRSLEEALRTIILAMKSNESSSLDSLRRTVIHNAIQICHYSPHVVLAAAYRAGVPLPLVIGAAEAAGVSRDAIASALFQAGAPSAQVRAAFDQAERLPEPPVSLFLPPPFETGGGLGQASPFRP